MVGMVSSRLRNKSRKVLRRPAERVVPASSSEEFFNRELSWLEFNRRVLAQSQSASIPLLERLRFLTIFTSNLDEFFQSRVGKIKQRLEFASPGAPWKAGLETDLTEIRRIVLELCRAQDAVLSTELRSALRDNGIHLLKWQDLSAAERVVAKQLFHDTIFPVLTPLAVDPGHPFPFISNLSLSLGVLLKQPEHDEELFARVKVPSVLPQLIKVGKVEHVSHVRVISLIEVVRHNLHELFPGMEVQAVLPFRITRNAGIEVDSEDGEDLVELISQGLKERKFASVVRLEVAPNPHPSILQCLRDELGLRPEDVFVSESAMEHLVFKEVSELNIPHLKFEAWTPIVAPQLSDEDTNILTAMRSSEILVHHPYESFNSSVERFLRTAVDDPRVLSIKMTLYRLGDHSALIPLLIRAAEQSKQVAVLVEVKASLDEARNIRHAQMLEDAGVHVVHGVVGLKTHAKVLLVARREHNLTRCYAHIGTGNYNSSTARAYTDIGLFTSDKETCEDLVELFHFLTGRSLKRDYTRIRVAPVSMRDSIIAEIEREIELCKKGQNAHIVIKANSLEDHGVCRALLKAAQAGVLVDLIIRGICCLRPTIINGGATPRIISIVGRFLEHSRVYYFRNGANDPLDGNMYISSADPMYRNLHRRVEVAVPLLERSSRERVWELLSAQLHDTVSAWELRPDGTYVQRQAENGPVSMGSQQLLMRLYRDRARQAGMAGRG